MTIHGAKGLEFPIVVCSGTTTQAGAARRRGAGALPARRRYEVKLRQARADRRVRAAQGDRRADGLPREAAAALRRVHARPRSPRRVGAPRRSHELPDDRRRLHRRRAAVGRGRGRDGRASTSRRRRAASPCRRRRAPGAARPRRRGSPSTTPRSRPGARRRFVSATTLARLADDAARATIPASRRTVATSSCRRGTRVATAPRSAARCTRCCRPSTSRPARACADLAAAQAAAEGVLGYEATIVDARAVRARERRPCAAACAAQYWRETYVAVPVEGLTLEGYVDLVYRDGEPATVSSSSTTRPTRSPTTPTLAARLAHYRVQAAAYAIAVAAATGERVDRCVFVFLAPDGGARGRDRAAPSSRPRSPRSRALIRTRPRRPARRSARSCSPTPEPGPIGRAPRPGVRCAILVEPVKTLPLRRQLRADRRARRGRARGVARAARPGGADAHGRRPAPIAALDVASRRSRSARTSSTATAT